MAENDDLRPVARRERPNEFGVAGAGRVAVYQGQRPVVETTAAEIAPPKPKTVAKMQRLGLSYREALFLRALVGSSTYVEAYERAFPNSKAKYSSRRLTASRMHKSIEAKIGNDGMLEAMGCGRQKVVEKLRQLTDAKMVRTFIQPETGAIIESPEYNDNTTQLNATKLLANIHKMTDDGKGGSGPVTVNIINYAPPGSPGWPGGGRG